MSKIGEFVIQAAREAGLDDSAVYAVELSVDEACTNIIEHAYGGESKGDIELSCQITPTGITVILKDTGKPFNPETVPTPNICAPLEELKPRGAGLYLIRKMMDKVDFSISDEGENVLTMVKNK